MPKAKKIRSNALVSQQVRHEPLGQVIEGDEMRGKYAAPSRGRRKIKSGNDEEEFLDEKTSKRILDMTRDQQNLMEMEERARRQKNIQHQQAGVVDSDDEYEEEEDIVIDEEE